MWDLLHCDPKVPWGFVAGRARGGVLIISVPLLRSTLSVSAPDDCSAVFLYLVRFFLFFQTLRYISVLRSQNYLFSAPTPAPHLSIISAPAPAPTPAIYCHLKLYYNSSTIRNMSQLSFFFILILASFRLTVGNIY